MKILGISGSSRDDSLSGIHNLVKTVLENTGIDFELISLRGKNISEGGTSSDTRQETYSGKSSRLALVSEVAQVMPRLMILKNSSSIALSILLRRVQVKRDSI